ncbi:hypothetical protein AAC387_Pa02g3749 [Persea americana]
MAAMISSLFLGGKVPSQKQVVQTQTTADDQKVINQIIEAHKPDANFAVDEKPLLSMVMDILSQATPTPPQDPKIDSMVPEAKSLPAISEELAFTIHKIGCELSCECSGIVACSTQSIGLMNLPYMVSIKEVRKRLTELTRTLKKIHGNLTTMLDQCNQKIKEKKENEERKRFGRKQIWVLIFSLVIKNRRMKEK